jgi:hypothetical protein
MKIKTERYLVASLAFMLLACASCTYDYFVDETNYKIFVPEVASGAVQGCYVAVYDEAGRLVRSRVTGTSIDDPRTRAGIFAFRLQPGKYAAYCYANVDELQVSESSSADQSFVSMKQLDTIPAAYALPPELLFRKLSPVIGERFEQRVDTVSLERYVGRITVRFKNIPVDLQRVAAVQLRAEGIATRQYFSSDTLPSRHTEEDHIFDSAPVTAPLSGSAWEMDHYYFPSIDGQLTRLSICFIDSQGTLINEIPVEVSDAKTAMPLTLLHGRRIILEIDSYTVIGIGIADWDNNIKDAEREI